HCDIALTYHKNSRRLKCHYCDYEEPVPLYCPECESDLIRYFGTGTQRVEEALTKHFPEAGIIRMDVDTTRRKGAHERLLHRFARFSRGRKNFSSFDTGKRPRWTTYTTRRSCHTVVYIRSLKY